MLSDDKGTCFLRIIRFGFNQDSFINQKNQELGVNENPIENF